MKEIVFFSNNKNKISEIKKIFNSKKIKLLTLNDFPLINSPPETGKTFNENAKIKSDFGLKKFNLPCFADDSGICIDALDGEPGVNSKKFIEEDTNQEELFKKIINVVIKKNKYTAYFQTSISLSINKYENFFFEGRVSGIISKKARGLNGFGYDPIFLPNGFVKSFAEMTSLEKNKISHRSIALNKLMTFIN